MPCEEMAGEMTVAGSSLALKMLSLSISKVWKFFGFTIDESGEITDKSSLSTLRAKGSIFRKHD